MDRRKSTAGAVGLLAAGAVAGAVLAGSIGANAASSGSGTTSSPPAASGQPRPPGPGGAAPVRSDEKAVTGSTLRTLTAAALKAVPGGTVIRVETDAGDGVYEAHMRNASGNPVTVKFDKNLAVTKIEDGMGQGDPRPAGGPPPGGVPPAGAPPAGAPGASSSSTSTTKA